MPLVNFKRFIQPVILHNEKEKTYVLGSLTRADVQNLLSSSLLQGGGIFGMEGLFGKEPSPMVAFAPAQVKLDWKTTVRDPRFIQLQQSTELVNGLQATLEKSSVFPIALDSTVSVIEQLEQLATDHVSIYYQVLLNYRQDAWQERMMEQYDAYLEGVEAPADSRVIRRIQQKLNERMDQFLSWEYKHLPIEEVEEKVNEVGYQHNIRIVLVGGNKVEQKKIKKQIENIFHTFAYLNDWKFFSYKNSKLYLEQIGRRKMDLSTKMQVLTAPEMVPLLVQQASAYVEKVVPMIKKTNQRVSFDLLPLGSELKSAEGNQIAKNLAKALLALHLTKEEMVVKRIQNGPSTIRLTIQQPKDLKLSLLTKQATLEDLRTHIGYNDIRIQSGDNIGEIAITVPVEDRQKVFLRNYLDRPAFYEFARNHPLPFFVGVDEIGEPLYRCLSEAKHLLVAGSTGSGKSVWMNQLLLALFLYKKPEELHAYLVDVKQVEFPMYEEYPHVQRVITKAEEAIGLLKGLREEVDRRYSLFKELGVRDIGLYNNKTKGEKLPYILVAIDEYRELTIREEKVHQYIESISQLARAAGVHLIVATQSPKAEVISSIIKSNLPSKIGFRCSNVHMYSTFLSAKPPFNLLGKGDGVLSFEDQAEEHLRFQGCLIIDDPYKENKEGKLIREIGSKLAAIAGKSSNGLNIIEEEMVVPMTEKDRLKQVIATTGETRVTQLRDIMKVNMNRLNELMKELVEEGWLLKPETKQQGYQIGVEEEELEKWRE